MTARSDNFNRSNTTTGVGTPSGGGADWVQYDTGGGKAYGISSNTAYVAADAGGHLVTGLDAATPDVEIEVTLSTFGDQIGLAPRISDELNHLYLRGFSGEGYHLFKRVAGSSTSLGSYSTTPASSDVIKVVCDGNDLEVFVNSVSRITASDGFNNTEEIHGLWGFNAASGSGRFDDFSIADLGGGPATAVPILIGGKLINSGLLMTGLVK